jgi:uncharacterized protein HemX
MVNYYAHRKNNNTTTQETTKHTFTPEEQQLFDDGKQYFHKFKSKAYTPRMQALLPSVIVDAVAFYNTHKDQPTTNNQQQNNKQTNNQHTQPQNTHAPIQQTQHKQQEIQTEVENPLDGFFVPSPLEKEQPEVFSSPSPILGEMFIDTEEEELIETGK